MPCGFSQTFGFPDFFYFPAKVFRTAARLKTHESKSQGAEIKLAYVFGETNSGFGSVSLFGNNH